jgi:hypothetical protein
LGQAKALADKTEKVSAIATQSVFMVYFLIVKVNKVICRPKLPFTIPFFQLYISQGLQIGYKTKAG